MADVESELEQELEQKFHEGEFEGEVEGEGWLGAIGNVVGGRELRTIQAIIDST